MRNKFLYITLALILSFSLYTGNAAAFRILAPADGPVATDNLSTTPKTSFPLTETPYIYLEFDKSSFNLNEPLYISWIWQHTDDTTPSAFEAQLFPTSSASDPLQIWKTAANWDSIKKTGDWTIQSIWWNPSNGTAKGGLGAGQATIAVTPEPVSTILFLVGGGVFGLAGWRKKSKK